MRRAVTYSAKLAALNMMFKHHNLYKENNAASAPNLMLQIVLK